MKYTPDEINKFREYVAQASDYAHDARDRELTDNLDEVLDFLVYVLDTFYPMKEEASV
jgi:hypothetical protein